VIRKLDEPEDRSGGAQRRSATHLVKSGTPTMGGSADPDLDRAHDPAVGRPVQSFHLGVLLVTLGFGWIGWIDDYRKVVHAIRRACRRARSTSGSR
jgi:phospho-N-acetylmuramoyl-pentapeptide-transferase